MSGRMKKAFHLFWHLLLTSLFLVLVFRNVEPLKTINEMCFAPWYLLIFVLFASSVFGFTIAFNQGREIKKSEA
jgi:uncharacterized integral membrane protein